MKATCKIVAAEYCSRNDQTAINSVWASSPGFCTQSVSGVIMIRMVNYSSKITSSLSPLSSSLLPASQVTHCLSLSKSQEGWGTETTEIGKSVNVKFQMKIECQFGDHILMVGDDPLLGSWNPLNAIPFNWSEGHLWTLVLEMPVDKSFKYKFLVKRSSGEILWQPGPDRVFIPWETENVIIVSEEWATAEGQKTIERQIIDENEKPINKTLVDDPLPIVAENITVSVSDESQTVNINRSGVNVETGAHSRESPSSSATKSLDKSSQKKRLTRKSVQREAAAEKRGSVEEGCLVTSDEGPVLVPGLTVKTDSEEDIVNEHHQSVIADSQPQIVAYKDQEYHVYRFD